MDASTRSICRWLAASGGAPLQLLAKLLGTSLERARQWATGASATGLVALHPADAFLRLTPTAARDLRLPRPSNHFASPHHKGTLAAVVDWQLRHGLDLSVVSLVLEPQLRQRAQRGRRTRRGDRLAAYPDAVVEVRINGASTVTAIELISTKYSDAMIAAKGQLRALYPDVVFYADTQKTAARVERILGESCRCI